MRQVEEALWEQLGEQRDELRQKQRELREALGEVKEADTVMILETGKARVACDLNSPRLPPKRAPAL